MGTYTGKIFGVLVLMWIAAATSFAVELNLGNAVDNPVAGATDKVLCAPSAKVLRWIQPFEAGNEPASAEAATAAIIDSNVGTFWRTNLDALPYLAWEIGVSQLMQLFGSSANVTPGEPFEHRGLIGLRNVKLTCSAAGIATGVTYNVDRSPGYTLLPNVPDNLSPGKVYHRGEQFTPLEQSQVLSGNTATITVKEKSRLAPPGQWSWTILLGYGMPWIWEQIIYRVSCGGTVDIDATGSAFPGAKLTFGTISKTWDQKELVEFVKSGEPHAYNSLNPPGGNAPAGPRWIEFDTTSPPPCAQENGIRIPPTIKILGNDFVPNSTIQSGINTALIINNGIQGATDKINNTPADIIYPLTTSTPIAVGNDVNCCTVRRTFQYNSGFPRGWRMCDWGGNPETWLIWETREISFEQAETAFSGQAGRNCRGTSYSGDDIRLLKRSDNCSMISRDQCK